MNLEEGTAGKRGQISVGRRSPPGSSPHLIETTRVLRVVTSGFRKVCIVEHGASIWSRGTCMRLRGHGSL